MILKYIIYLYLNLSIMCNCVCTRLCEKRQKNEKRNGWDHFYLTGLRESNILKQYEDKPTYYYIYYQYTDNEMLALTCVKEHHAGGTFTWMLNDHVLQQFTMNMPDITSRTNFTFNLRATQNNSTIKCAHTPKSNNRETKQIIIRLSYNDTSEIATSLVKGSNEQWIMLIVGSVGVVSVVIIFVTLSILYSFRTKKNKIEAINNVKVRDGKEPLAHSNKQKTIKQCIENGQLETHNEACYVNTILNNESSKNDNLLYENVVIPDKNDNTKPCLNYASIMLPSSNGKFEANYAPQYAQIMKDTIQMNNNVYSDEQTEPAYCEIEFLSRK